MKKRPRDPKPLPPVLASATGPALIKFLASCNTTVRSQSLRLIHSWLASQSDSHSHELSEADIKKLWKGLFYCLWHADKTPNQVALIDRLTSLFLSLQPSLSLEFFRWFLLTLRREWSGIDRLRLDKFYLLIRRFIKALFELMRLRNWDVDVLGDYFGVLEKDGFLADDKLQGSGVNYHLVSVFLEELKGVGFPVRKEVVEIILRPFFAVMMRSEDKILLGKVKSYLFDELLKIGKGFLGKKMGEDCDENDGDTLFGLVALRMGLSARFYGVGSSTECIQGNRKVALGLHGEFLKLEKDMESSGIEIAIPEYSFVVGEDDGAEVPQLIPIEFDGKNNISSTRPFEEAKSEGAGDEDQADIRMVKKQKKAKKEMDGDDMKRKKKKEKEKEKKEKKDEKAVPVIESVIVANAGIADSLNETVISNLQKQFEQVAAEMASNTEIPLIAAKKGKRKRRKGGDAPAPDDLNENGTTNGGVDTAAVTSVDKSAKRVRFSMKNNLVWKPQNPLPPESLRLPPSVTPRGSALKKGVSPGPIVDRQPLPFEKKVKQKKKMKKGQNRLQKATPVKKQHKKV